MRSDEDEPSTSTRAGGQIRFQQQSGPHRVVDIVVDVGDDVRDAGDLPFDGAGAVLRVGPDGHPALALRVARDSVAHLPREVEALTLVLEHVDDAQALLVVVEATRDQVVQHPLAGMAEGRVAEVVAERDGLGQLLVEPQHLGDAAGNLRDLERMREARAVVVAGRREEHLRLVLEPAERLAVNHAVAIPLECGPDGIFRFRTQPPARIGALGRLWRQDLALARLQLFSYRHVTAVRCPCHARAARQREAARHACAPPPACARKLVPWSSGPTPNTSASVCARSANVGRTPRSVPGCTPAP